MSSAHRPQQLPTAVLNPIKNSHPFDQRSIAVPISKKEEDEVKIGRSIIRLQPMESNAIFDCKVSYVHFYDSVQLSFPQAYGLGFVQKSRPSLA